MPSFLDSGFIVLLALLLFGPKKLPVLARQLGKLMADFRRASTEFRTQMEEELRISEQADRQKQIAAIEAAAPPTPALDAPASEPGEPHTPPPEPTFASTTEEITFDPGPPPLPIASSGELSIMPPATGLPVANSSLGPLIDAIPEVSVLDTPHHPAASNGIASDHPHRDTAKNGAGTANIGAAPEPARETESRPWMI